LVTTIKKVYKTSKGKEFYAGMSESGKRAGLKILWLSAYAGSK